MKKSKCNANAELWIVEICEGALDMVHGNFQHIREIYIPKHKVSVNIVNSGLHAFINTDSGRYDREGCSKIDDICLPEDFIRDVVKYAKMTESLYLDAKEIFEKALKK